MEEADKDWMMIRIVGGWVNVSSGTGSPGSPGQRAVKRLLLLLLLCMLMLAIKCCFWLLQASDHNEHTVLD